MRLKKSFNRKSEKAKIQHISRVKKRPQTECHYCGVKIYGDKITREHIKPVSKGGTDHPSNIVFSCKSCNSARGNSDYEAFKKKMLVVKRGAA